MPEIPSDELEVYETFPQPVLRYCSVAPRIIVYQGQVNGAPSRDSKSKGFYKFEYDGATGTLADCIPGMTIDIGTSAGARDIGSVRLRKAPDSDTMFIEEIAAGKVPIENNHYFSVVEEFYPRLKLPRLVGIKNNAGFVNSFTEYHDYDIPYTNQNTNIQPQANITENSTSFKGVKQADWVDVGQVYRTITLSLAKSLGFGGATISSRLWDEKDCTITVGTNTSSSITLQVPVGHRIISARVTDSNGATHTRRLHLWTHDDSYPPLTVALPTQDDRDEGRIMRFEASGPDGLLDTDALPAGTAICYWEVAKFDGETAPESYIDSFVGWLKSESTTMKLNNRSTLSFDVEGIAARASGFIGFAQKVSASSNINKWFKMNSITIDKMIHYFLREYTTILNVCNFYISDVTTTVRSEDVKKGDIWSQINDLAKGYSGHVRADSYNSIWCRRHYSYMELGDRSDVENIMSLNKSHWLDEDGITVEYSYTNKTSIVTGSGSFVSGSKNKLVFSKAPGLVPAESGNDEEAPFQRTISQDALNKLTGHHYARVNSPYSEFTVKLKGNWDFFEPAWGEVITITWVEESLRGTQVEAVTYTLNKVSVSHSVEAGQPAKTVSLTLERATLGEPGITYTPPNSPTPQTTANSTNYPKIDYPTYSPAEWFNVPPSVPTLAVMTNELTSSERFYVLRDTQDNGTEWEESFAAGTGTGLGFVSDPFSPLYLGTSTNVNGWWLTDTRINRITDVFASGGASGTSQSTHPVSFSLDLIGARIHFLWASRISNGHVMGIGYENLGGGDYQPYILRTIDGATWTYDNTTLPVINSTSFIGGYKIDISAKVPGLVYISGFEELWRSTDYGATFTEVSIDHPNLILGNFESILHIPFAANPRGDRFYFAKEGIVGVISGSLVDAVTSGNRLYYYDMTTKAIAIIPWPHTTKYAFAALQSNDKDPTKLAALMWDVFDYDELWHGSTIPHAPYAASYLLISENAGKAWVNRGQVGDADNLKMPSSAPKFLYIYGAQPSRLTSPFPVDAGKPYISVSNDFGKHIVNGTRNLVDFTASRIHHICGAY